MRGESAFYGKQERAAKRSDLSPGRSFKTKETAIKE